MGDYDKDKEGIFLSFAFRAKPILLWNFIQRRTKAPDVVSFVTSPPLPIPTKKHIWRIIGPLANHTPVGWREKGRQRGRDRERERGGVRRRGRDRK